MTLILGNQGYLALKKIMEVVVFTDVKHGRLFSDKNNLKPLENHWRTFDNKRIRNCINLYRQHYESLACELKLYVLGMCIILYMELQVFMCIAIYFYRRRLSIYILGAIHELRKHDSGNF